MCTSSLFIILALTWADPDLQLWGAKLHNGGVGRSPQWGKGAKLLVRGSQGRYFLISETNFITKLPHKFRIFRLHRSVGARLHQHIMIRGQRPDRGTLSLWSCRHFLISKTNFLTKFSHKFEIFRQHRSVGTRLHQNIMVRGPEGLLPLKLRTFSYFRDYFLNKIITEIGKIRTKNVCPFAWGGQSPWQSCMGAWPDWPPLDPPLHPVAWQLPNLE